MPVADATSEGSEQTEHFVLHAYFRPCACNVRRTQL